MAKNPLHLRLSLDADQRLAAAAGGAMRVFADAAGLSNDKIAELQVAVLSACNLCFMTHHDNTSRCRVDFHRLDDRIEVELSVPGEKAPEEMPATNWTGVDEVKCENREDSGVLRLTKFVSTIA